MVDRYVPEQVTSSRSSSTGLQVLLALLLTLSCGPPAEDHHQARRRPPPHQAEPGPWVQVAPPPLGTPRGPVYHQGPEEPPRAVHWRPAPPQLETEGSLIVQLVVTERGRIARARVLRGRQDEATAELLAENLRQWRFEPARLRGKPVAVYFDVDLGSPHFETPPGPQ